MNSLCMSIESLVCLLRLKTHAPVRGISHSSLLPHRLATSFLAFGGARTGSKQPALCPSGVRFGNGARGGQELSDKSSQ